MLKQDVVRLFRYHCHLTNALPLEVKQLVVVDCRDISAAQLQNWLSRANFHPKMAGCVLIQTRPHGEHEQLMDWPQVKGIIARGTNRHLTLKGIQAICQGELWFSRRQYQQFLHRRRYQPQYSTLDDKTLSFTLREGQMLRCLYAGLSNAAIAQQMGVSAHTVKSHLYNLYRKIGVRSRLEASSWLRDKAAMLFDQFQH